MVILYMEMEPRRTAAGRGKEHASIAQAVDVVRNGRVRLLYMVPLLAQKRWQWGREIGDSIITGDSNEREMLGKCKLLTAWECAKKLMLHCAAELVDVQIPVQVCRSFQTRDILRYKALWVFLTTAMGNKYLVFADPSYVTY